MNPVVDQGHLCQSCWAFAATASIEGMYAIRFGEKLKLSEQQMIDCDININQNCRGGSPYYALVQILDAGGQMKSSDYPYVGFEHSCQLKKSKVAVKVRYIHRPYKNKHDIRYGPIPAAI